MSCQPQTKTIHIVIKNKKEMIYITFSVFTELVNFCVRKS